jgi:DUF4097 and DUF4098 domain-containing protein YvlB
MININGMSFSGQNIQITNNRIYIDGKLIEDPEAVESKTINITVDGNVSKLEVDNAESVTVTGDAGSVKTVNGNVRVGASIQGDVKTVNGNVTADVIEGRVSTVNGNIR